MAKNNKAKWVGLGLTTLAMITAVIVAFVWAQADIKAVDVKADSIVEDVKILKFEGCLPSRANTNDITEIKTRLDTIQTTQTKNFREILRRLPDDE